MQPLFSQTGRSGHAAFQADPNCRNKITLYRSELFHTWVHVIIFKVSFKTDPTWNTCKAKLCSDNAFFITTQRTAHEESSRFQSRRAPTGVFSIIFSIKLFTRFGIHYIQGRRMLACQEEGGAKAKETLSLWIKTLQRPRRLPLVSPDVDVPLYRCGRTPIYMWTFPYPLHIYWSTSILAHRPLGSITTAVPS